MSVRDLKHIDSLRSSMTCICITFPNDSELDPLQINIAPILAIGVKPDLRHLFGDQPPYHRSFSEASPSCQTKVLGLGRSRGIQEEPWCKHWCEWVVGWGQAFRYCTKYTKIRVWPCFDVWILIMITLCTKKKPIPNNKDISVNPSFLVLDYKNPAKLRKIPKVALSLRLNNTTSPRKRKTNLRDPAGILCLFDLVLW